MANKHLLTYLRTRAIDDQLKVHENMQNQLCKLRLLKSRTRASPDFTVEEVDQAIENYKMVSLLTLQVLSGNSLKKVVRV